MKLWLTGAIWVLILCRGGGEEFAPPQAYPMSRYEAGWQKNPFTLKTAPVAIQRESFAKDLVLGSVYKIGGSTSVTVVNTKTHARTPLHDNEPDAEGIKVKSVHMEDSRKDTYVELELGSDSAVVRYDESFFKQLASAHQGQLAKTGAGTLTLGNGNPVNGTNPPPLPQAANAPGAPRPATLQYQNNGGVQHAPGPYSLNQPALPTSANVSANIPTPTRRRLNTGPIPNQVR